ncbi:MAG: GNAT family N-acetyltransferase [Chloroflexota bacterium]
MLIETGGTTPGALRAAVARIRAQGTPVRVTLREPDDDALVPIVRELGLVPRPWAPGMLLRPIPPDGPSPAPDLDIRPVTDPAGLEDFIRAMGPSYGLSVAATRIVVAPGLLDRPDVRLVAGRVDGEPVAVGMGIRTGPVVGVYFIGTVPSARRRGYGEAITVRVVSDAAALGCDTAVLQASPSGLGVYQRLGYRAVTTYMGWVPPAA